jgi:hypothetical protein
MDIDIDRNKRHVAISMAGYIDRLFQIIRPNGTKGVSTPNNYDPLNYKTREHKQQLAIIHHWLLSLRKRSSNL